MLFIMIFIESTMWGGITESIVTVVYIVEMLVYTSSNLKYLLSSIRKVQSVFIIEFEISTFL